MGIFETMLMNDDIRELVLQRATTDEIHALAIHHGMQTMRNDGWLKICLGVSTFEEVTRQTPRESQETIKAEMESARRSLDRIDKLRIEREAEDKRVDTEGFDDAHEKPAAAPAAGPAVALAAPPVSQPAAPPPVPEELISDEAAAQLPGDDSVI